MALLGGGLGAFVRGAADTETSTIDNQQAAQAADDAQKKKFAQEVNLEQIKGNIEQQNQLALAKQRSSDAASKSQDELKAYMSTQAQSDGRNMDGTPVSSTTTPQSPLQSQTNAALGQDMTAQPVAQAPQQPMAQPQGQNSAVQAMVGNPQSAQQPSPTGGPQAYQAQQKQNQANGPAPAVMPTGQPSTPQTPNAPQQVPGSQETSSSPSAQPDTSQPATPPDFKDQIAAKQGLVINDQDKQRVANASSPVNALTPNEYQQYLQAKATESDSAAEKVLNNSNSSKLWNWYHQGVLPNGVEVDPAYGNINDPLYDKSNSAYLHTGSKASYMQWVNNATKQGNKIDIDGQVNLNDSKMRNDQLALSTVGRSSEGAFTSTNQELQKIIGTAGPDAEATKSAQSSLANHITALEQQAQLNGTKNLRSLYEFKALSAQLPSLSNTPEGRLAIAQNTYAIEAGNQQSLEAMQAYQTVNGHLLGANRLAVQYQKENPIFTPTSTATGIDPLHPENWINPNVRSFDNWQAIKTGAATQGPNGVTIDNKTGQVRPDELRDNLKTVFAPSMVQNAQGQQPQQPSPQTQKALSQFGL